MPVTRAFTRKDFQSSFTIANKGSGFTKPSPCQDIWAVCSGATYPERPPVRPSQDQEISIVSPEFIICVPFFFFSFLNNHLLIFVYSTTGGRRFQTPVACSKAWASWSTRKSSLCRPTICMPTGRPSGVNPQGTEMAGRPVTVM